MKYYLIAGEASGDLHGANLMKSILKLDPVAEFRFWGGDKMAAVGGTMVEHYKNTAFMGFIEVLLHLQKILGFISKCKSDINTNNPDVIVLLDYPGFNLRIAKWAKSNNYKVVYYITPQVWAWHKSRVHDLGKFTDLLLVILPFESAFFSKYGYPSTFVGHPLLDAIAQFEPDPNFAKHRADKKTENIVALLPGSRKQEINAILPVMLEALRNSAYNILLAGAPSIDDSLYLSIINQKGMEKQVTLIRNRTYDILQLADLALVGSGTATLETALFNVPQIVCYKGSAISYQIAKRLVDLKYISLVNLISDKAVVRELIQDELTVENLRLELEKITAYRQQILMDYKTLRLKLGDTGASDRAAKAITNL